MITTDLVDKRRTLYKTIRENGLVVDCAVPKGDRKADRTVQDAALDAAVEDVLRDSGKRMDPAVRRVMYDMTGFRFANRCCQRGKTGEFHRRPACDRNGGCATCP
jgi:DNA polymerase-3 subunit delta